MSYHRDDTRFGFPPERDPFERFPSEIPWDMPISEMGWWLDVQTTQPFWAARLPLRLMAARYGWKLTLRDILPRLSREGRPPDRVLLIAKGGMEYQRAKEGRDYLVLLGEAPVEE